MSVVVAQPSIETRKEPKRSERGIWQDSFAPLPSNAEAVKAAELFIEGLLPHVAIVGPTGLGKTHLLQAISERYQTKRATTAELLTAQEALAVQGRIVGHRALILDDVQEVFGKPKQRQVLRVLLERRIKSGRPTIVSIAADKPNRQIKLFLPHSREWSMATIAEPAPEERVLLIEQLCRSEGLKLSRELVHILARHLRVNGHSLSGALNRLRLAGDEWVGARAALRACGVLYPYFSDSPDWDLARTIRQIAEDREPQAASDLALYTMMCVAGIPESHVARSIELTPAQAYIRAAKLRKQLPNDPAMLGKVKGVVTAIVASLAVE